MRALATYSRSAASGTSCASTSSPPRWACTAGQVVAQRSHRLIRAHRVLDARRLGVLGEV
jgi:hypothetical protein